jgi:transposase-like protein
MTADNEDAAGTAGPAPSASTPASTRGRFASLYTAELAERILNEVQGGRALLSVCRDDGVPAYNTVYGWVLRDVEGFAARYARARDIGGRRGARAIQYTTELADHILREVERGRSLHDVCRDDGMPAYSTVLGWTVRLGEFAARYHRARAIGNPRHGGETLYSAELADRILAGLASGHTLHDICLDDDMPSCRTVYHWVSEDHEGFTARYYQARDAGRCQMGRPTLYTPELAERILHELADGRTVRDICRAVGMPASATVRLWVVENRDGFAARYRQAREFARDDMEEELLEIVDDGRNDWMERRTRAGGRETVPNRENIQRSRLRYDARCRLLSNPLPKCCGNRIAPAAKDEVSNPWVEILRLVDGKSRGLPSQRQPIDPRELEEFKRKFLKADGPPSDRL